MKPCEALIAEESEYYVYAPSLMAKDAFYYVICTGHFLYRPKYYLKRDAYDSFLLMYIEEGELAVEWADQKRCAREGQFVLMNCYEPHAYYTDKGCRCLWCHFDGYGARTYFDAITTRLGSVFSIRNAFPILFKLKEVFELFAPGNAIKEPLVSKYLTDILTALLLYSPDNPTGNQGVSEPTMTFINEHFKEELSNELLAERIGISPYHFIRIFKKETGFTPHEYLVRTRIDMAKYLLKNTGLSVKDICYNTGFSCESVFCSSFKKNVGMTPVNYRSKGEVL